MIPTPPPHAVALTRIELYEVFHRNGAPALIAETFAAIALRESGGIPTAYNGNAATGDDSCGLMQINWKVPQIVASLATIGITKKEQLFDPDTTARAAWHLSGGDSATPAQRLANMRLLWYLDRMNPDGTPTAYKIKYEQHIAEIHAAALQSTLA